ncbi:MAG: hypothetical protein KF878_10285 [Planctomycetes bacterium]|nr:hypothetical protein [Planctomycetota bacterium]
MTGDPLALARVADRLLAGGAGPRGRSTKRRRRDVLPPAGDEAEERARRVALMAWRAARRLDLWTGDPLPLAALDALDRAAG